MFLDLVAVGMAADMQSLQESETAYLIRTGLNQIKNPFISTLIKNSSFESIVFFKPIARLNLDFNPHIYCLYN